MPNYYICQILKTELVVPTTTVYKNIELRSASKYSPTELSFIESSLKATGLSHDIKPNLMPSIATIININQINDIKPLAENCFIELIDLLQVEFPYYKFSLTPCGFIKNLDTGEYTALTEKEFDLGNFFLRRQHSIEQINATQRLLYINNMELFDRYKRSLHWSRNAKLENSIQLRILFRWFAIEAIFKANESDDITSLLLLFLGFPESTYSKHISRSFINRLSMHKAYKIWKRKIRDHIEEIRKYRNNSVHSGFRAIDHPISKLKLYDKIMHLAIIRCQAGVRTGLSNRINTIAEFKEYAGLIFENQPNVENDIINTVIFSLDNNHL